MQNTNVVVVGVFLDSFYNYRWQDLHACEKRNFPVLAYIPYLQQFSVVFFYCELAIAKKYMLMKVTVNEIVLFCNYVEGYPLNIENKWQ